MKIQNLIAALGNILFSIFYQGRRDKNAPRLAGKAKFAQELSV